MSLKAKDNFPNVEWELPFYLQPERLEKDNLSKNHPTLHII